MIRKFKENDIEKVMKIWLESNISAHSFIDESYWRDNFEMVKYAISEADLYIYEENNNIKGFAGVVDGYIAGIFVEENSRSKGIGGKILKEVKENYPELTLSVYEKNKKAIRFYEKEGFKLVKRKIDEGTGETEVIMKWM